jgi:EmrB/QacA subfamily drug resistance transporter
MNRWRVFAIVSVGMFMAGLDLFIVNIAFPDIRRDFHGASLAGMSWILSAYAIVFAALLVTAGRISDRVGRKRGFVWGLAVFLAASAASAAAPSLEVLVAARIVQAAGAAFMVPTSLGLLLPEFPPEQRATAVGAWAAVGGIAAAAGPPIGGLLVQASWRWVFLVNLPVGLVALAAAMRTLQERRDPDPGPRPDVLGAAMLASGTALLVLGIVKGPDWGWTSGGVLGSFVAAAVLMPAFLLRCVRHAAPVVELPMLRVRSFAVANLGALVFFAGFSAMLLGSVLYMTGVWHDSVLRAGLSLSPGPLMAALFSFPAGALSDRFGQRAVGAPGPILFALGCLWWVWQVGAEPHYASEMLPGLLLTGAGVGLTIPTLSSAAAASLPPQRFSTGIGVLTMSRQIGSALGVAILIAIVGTPAPGDAVSAFDHAWIFMAITAAAAFLAFLALGRVRVTGTGEPAPPPAPAPASHTRERVIRWEDPVAVREQTKDLAPLERLNGIRDGTVPPPPIAATMGLEIVEATKGRAVFVVRPDEYHYNPIGSVHGGLAATLLDSALGCAVETTLDAGVAFTTLELKVNYVRPMTRETGRVVCEATVLHRGGTVATAEGRVVAEESGKLIAHGTTTCLVLGGSRNGHDVSASSEKKVPIGT